MTVEELSEYLRAHWLEVRNLLTAKPFVAPKSFSLRVSRASSDSSSLPGAPRRGFLRRPQLRHPSQAAPEALGQGADVR